ncbi:2039_t:CDS:1, partial [Gigaspora rosea]
NSISSKEIQLSPPKPIPISTPFSLLLTLRNAATIFSWIDHIIRLKKFHINLSFYLEVVEMGFYGETFHKLRDNIPGTMVILKTYNEILDGYNPLSWKTGD